MAFFIYPASVSQNCDKRIVPAAAKCMERYFLLQLQDAIASGIISFKRRYSNGTYGGIVMEGVRNGNKKQLVCEQRFLDSFVVTEASGPGLLDSDDLRTWYDSHYKPLTGRDYFGQKDINKFDDKEFERKYRPAKLKELMDAVESVRRDLEMVKGRAGTTLGRQTFPTFTNQDMTMYQHYNSILLDTMTKLGRIMEKAAKKSTESKPHSTGSYSAIDGKIDIIPTGGTVKAPVMLIGGPNDGKLLEDQEFNINVKVIPMMIKNFKDLENDMLNDYFSKVSESIFKRIKTAVVKKCVSILRSIPGFSEYIEYKMENGDDANEAKYGNEGQYVDASAFNKSSKAPGNYNFASNIVMFNKDDLTDPEDANIFENRSAMARMFRLGWSTFAMLDPVNEVMVFISSLDGGFMHYLPYSYMMESYGSKAYYGNDKKLKNDSRPFLIKRGNFSQFAKMFKK